MLFCLYNYSNSFVLLFIYVDLVYQKQQFTISVA